MKDAEAVTFAGGRLDRATRSCAASGAQARAARRSRARSACRSGTGRPLIEPGAPTRLGWLPMAARSSTDDPDPPVFLGIDAGGPRFARDDPRLADAGDRAEAPRALPRRQPHAHPRLPAPLAFGDLRAMMAELSAEEAGTAAAAKGILGWHAAHRFCANCGARLGGGRRRLAPLLPGLRRAALPAHRPGGDHADPARQRRCCSAGSPAWPPGMYSLLAGFMEPGESIEAAVRREVFEETGVAGRPGRLPVEPALALPVEPDDRLPRRGADARDRARPGRARGCPLGQPRGGDGGARRPATPTSAPPATARSPAS